MILVAKQPIKLLAGPSSSASVLYGFPAGRRFRLIGQEPGFAQLQDVKSGATGWIDETALGHSPGVPVATAPAQPKQGLRSHKEVTASSNPNPTSHAPTKKIASTPAKSKHTRKAATVEAKSENSAPEQPKRRGLFGLRPNSAQGVLF